MTMDILAKQSLEAAASIMGISLGEAAQSEEAKEIAYKLACAAMAQEMSDRLSK